jgi:DNA-binding NtrC family response regulator
MSAASILIVEDEDSIRLSLRDYLKKKGYEVHVASEGVGAIKQLLDNPIDLIVTDYRMDLLGGDYWLRFLERFCGAQEVILTSGFLKSDRPLPYQVVFKPYNYSDLAALVENRLEERRARGA